MNKKDPSAAHMNTKHEKDCRLGDNWKDCPACLENERDAGRMSKTVRLYFSKIGKIGGKKSRRSLTSEQAKQMQQLSLKAKKLKSLEKKNQHNKPPVKDV